MGDPSANGKSYMVSVFEPQGAGGELVFTFVPKGNVKQGMAPGHVPQFIVAARQKGDEITFDWSATRDDPESASAQMEQEVLDRIKSRAAWIDAVKTLVDQVETWARQLNWATRRVEKKVEDTWVGNHQVPALLMQEGTCRILLEPIGRSTAGAEGVVDLYLLPAYDDIASLYYYNGRWNLHYVFTGAEPVASVREAQGMPLTREAFEKVLAEMRQGAA